MDFLIIAAYLALLCLIIWLFLIRPRKPFADKISLLLVFVGVYTFAFGILAQTQILEQLATLAADMTSPNLWRFVRGNLSFLSMLSGAVYVAAEPIKTPYSAAYFLEIIILIFFVLLSLIYALVHIFIIAPLSYIFYLIVSVPVNAITTSTSDISFSIGAKNISIKNIVSANAVSTKNLLIAFQTIGLTLSIKVIALFRENKKKNTGSAANKALAAEQELKSPFYG